MIVGAPKANYSSISRGARSSKEPGAAYRCNLNTDKCEEFRPSTINDASGFIEQVNYNSSIKKESGWFGAAIALQEHSNILTVCKDNLQLNALTSNWFFFLIPQFL